MKQFKLTIALLIIALFTQAQYCGNSGPAACTPTGGPSGGGFENSTTIPCITVGSLYSHAVEFKIPSSITLNGITSHPDSIGIGSVSNLPCGICWSTNKATNTFAPNENGCLLLSGSGNDLPGQYKAEISFDVWQSGSRFQMPPSVADQLGIKLFLREKTAAGNCPAVNENGTNSTACTDVIYVNDPYTAEVCNGTLVNPALYQYGGQAPLNFAWSSTGSQLSCNNCQTPSATITQNSTYQVTITDANNITATATITYTIAAATATQIYTSAGSESFCQGGGANLYVPGEIAAYHWSDGSTAASLFVNQAGTYSVTATETSGCSVTGSISLYEETIQHATIIGNPNITAFGTFSYGVADNYFSYYWDITGGVLQSGQYTNNITVLWGDQPPFIVSLFAGNGGVCTDSSGLTAHIGTGIAQTEAETKTLYSYYNNGQNILKANDENVAPFKLQLFDVTGRQVFSSPTITSGQIVLPGNLMMGYYFAQATYNSGRVEKIKVAVR